MKMRVQPTSEYVKYLWFFFFTLLWFFLFLHLSKIKRKILELTKRVPLATDVKKKTLPRL